VQILVIINSLARGGAERVISTLSRSWESDGHTVSIAVFDSSDQAYEVGGNIIDLDLPPQHGIVRRSLTMYRRSTRLRKVMRTLEPDRIISFMETANFPAVMAAKKEGYLDRLIVSVRLNPAMFSPVSRFLMRRYYRHPAAVVGASSGISDAMVSDFGVDPGQVAWLPNPMDHGMVAKLGASDVEDHMFNGQPFLLAAGRLTRQKGFDLLLNAYASIQQDLDVDLCILGSGPEEGELKKQAVSSGISDRVHFLGAVENPYAYMSRCAAFVLSSRAEGWPNVLAEAMASGCAVVAFDCDYGPRDMIDHGVDGLLVPAEDARSLSESMLSVLEDSDRLEMLGRNARLRSEQWSTIEVSRRWLNELATV
jgi:GalNAc-alpha-(1->4)-GalNAc-alpha-(1->3)-diNAcBac-PP-undecaprenol alpha-1,4-N-acetyl-D-galactosaminyltransferase